MKVINLFGGAGIGKSTIAAELFSRLKKMNYNTELVTEYAKELIYQNRINTLENDQLYVLAKQHHKIKVLEEYSKNNYKIDYIIVDSPLLNNIIYNNSDYLNNGTFFDFVFRLYSYYDNINFFIQRNTDYEYSTSGRIQKNIKEAEFFDEKILKFLNSEKVPYYKFKNNDNIINNIVNTLLSRD